MKFCTSQGNTYETMLFRYDRKLEGDNNTNKQDCPLNSSKYEINNRSLTSDIKQATPRSTESLHSTPFLCLTVYGCLNVMYKEIHINI